MYFPSDYFTSLDFYHDITTTRSLLLSPTVTSPILNKEDIDINDNNTSTANNKKSILSIDTTTSKNSSKAAITKQEDQSVDNNNDNNDDIQQQKGNQEADMMVTSPGSAEFTDKLTTKQQQEDNVTKYIQNQQHHHRSRHNSVSAYSDVDFFIKSIPPVPHLSPSTSSVSSFSSNWSLDSGSNRSRVEEMIYLFEMGGRSTPHRRYSVDSHNYYTASKPLIRHRRFEYQPIASEWKKRANSTSVFPTIELSPSKST